MKQTGEYVIVCVCLSLSLPIQTFDCFGISVANQAVEKQQDDLRMYKSGAVGRHAGRS